MLLKFSRVLVFAPPFMLLRGQSTIKSVAENLLRKKEGFLVKVKECP